MARVYNTTDLLSAVRLQLACVVGHIGTLREYERLRQAHNLPLMMAIDLMARVYSTTNPVLLAAGNVALQVADSLSPIKVAYKIHDNCVVPNEFPI